MTDLDDDIRRALDEGFEFEGDDQSLMEMVRDSFRGRTRWLMILTGCFSFAFFGLSLWAVHGFLEEEDVGARIGWAMAFYFFSNAVGMLKNYHWMTMHRNSILREVKRVEYRIAKLAERTAR